MNTMAQSANSKFNSLWLTSLTSQGSQKHQTL